MKALFLLIATVTLLSTSGCIIREDRGGDGDYYWHGHHYEHWEHHDRD